MSAVFAQYELGAERLLSSISGRRADETGIDELRDHLVRLIRNVKDAERSDSDEARRERNEIVSLISRQALGFGLDFLEFCGLGVSYADWRAAQPWLSAALNSAEFSTITDQASAGFVGRQWLLDDIRAKVNGDMADAESGYVVVEGVPGWGKTAVAAEFVKRERWAHHYLTDGLSAGRAFVESAAAQLIVAYRLAAKEPLYYEANPPRVLVEVLDAATRDRSIWPVVIVLDGLDQADADFSRFLPRRLPAGSFIVITTQPQGAAARPFDVDAHRETIKLIDYQRLNEADVSACIAGYIERRGDAMAKRIAALGMSADAFMAEILARSEANFLYVTRLLPDIFSERITVQDLDHGILPNGLADYYMRRRNRLRMQVGADFDRLYLPVAAFLAARPRPRSVEWLADITELPRHEVKTALDGWRPFFEPIMQAGTQLWRPYHSSFRDFLHKEVELEPYRHRIDDRIKSYLDLDSGDDGWT